MYITTLIDSMKPASLSVLVLVPLDMTKFRRYLVCFPFQSYELSFFFLKKQVFEGLVVLLNRKKMKEHTHWLRYMQFCTDNSNDKNADL